jgi:hypothetical protein
MSTRALCLGLLAVGCASGPSAVDKTADPRSLTKKGGPVGIALLGRSVTEGWFQHWGAKVGGGHKHGRYRLLHRPFQHYEPAPSLWASQADAVLQRYGKHLHAVQYKLCFVDFNADTSLDVFRDVAEAMYKVVVKKHGKVLIIGNALPSMPRESTLRGGDINHVVRLNNEYNNWLQLFAKAHPRVVIFDQNKVLIDDKGFLRADYAQSPTDSHLKGVAYRAMDKAYFALLDKQFGAGQAATPPQEPPTKPKQPAAKQPATAPAASKQPAASQ